MTQNTVLSGRVAVVTGASSGLGEATAKRLAASGAKVAVLARRADRLETLVKEIERDGGTALALAVDLTDPAAVHAAAARVETELGTTSLLFNNAGVMLPGLVEDVPAQDWQRQIDLNISGLMTAIGAFVPQLAAAAAAGGVADLVNTSSMAAKNIYPNFAVYCGTKAYVTHMSRNLRAELGTKNVRVTALEPGLVRTELQSHVTDPGAREWLAGAEDSIEWLLPEDVAETVAFVAAQPPRVNFEQITILPTHQLS